MKGEKRLKKVKIYLDDIIMVELFFDQDNNLWKKTYYYSYKPIPSEVVANLTLLGRKLKWFPDREEYHFSDPEEIEEFLKKLYE